MSEWTIYHNPKCSKSRETLKLLRARGVEPEVIEYLKTPPDAATLRTLVGRLGIRPRDLVRTKEAAFKALTLDLEQDEAVLAALAAHPILIERPIVVRGDAAVLGRPPENVLQLV